MANVRINEKDNDKKRNIILLVIALIVGLSLLVTLGILLSKCAFTTGEPVTSQKDNYDTLLAILNKNIDDTKISENEKADKVYSFTYSENHFFIAGSSSTITYDLSINLSGETISSDVEAYNYVINHKDNLVMANIYRYDKSESVEFVNKYLSSDNGVATFGTMGTNQKVYGVFTTSTDTKVIYNENVATTLDDLYHPKSITANHELYKIYRYIALGK